LCTGLDKPRLQEFFANLANLKHFCLEKSRNQKKSKNQAIHTNPDTYVAPAPCNNVTKRIKNQRILPPTRKK